jgi:hypothetical protein
VLELGANEVMKKQLGEHGEPYKRGTPSKLSHLSQALILGGAGTLVRGGARSRAAAAAGGALLCAGALAARWTIFKAGFQSASDPKYVVGPQRAMIDRGERAGGSRRMAKVSEVQPERGSPATAVAP